MNNQKIIRFIFPALLSVFIFILGSSCLYAQKEKKNKARINVEYIKIMDGEIYFNIKTSARIEKKTVPVSNIELTIYNEIDDEEVELGKSKTNDKGESRFSLKDINSIKADTSNTYNILVSFSGNDSFNKAKKSISFKDANIEAEIITKDSINYISAILTDSYTKIPIVDESLTVHVQRLFKPLMIGEEFNNTDEDGAITVPIEEGIPGIDGKLTFEVVLNESDDYGTVKGIVTGTVGVPFEDESTFDQRTMWSPRGKTPIFLLLITYSGIFVVWGIIVYLIFNLYRIVKS
jgi:hypothetical protein